MLVLNLPAFELYDRFHGNGPYGKIPTKKGPIRTLGFALPYNKCNYSHFHPSHFFILNFPASINDFFLFLLPFLQLEIKNVFSA